MAFCIPRKGSGTISAAGGKGWGGGGGGRISLDCYSIQEDIKVTVHGMYFESMKYSNHIMNIVLCDNNDWKGFYNTARLSGFV